jgi:arsenate reductase
MIKSVIMPVRILILCTGNSCRSQMAEGFLKDLDPRLEVFSAGTKPASAVHPRAIAVMKEYSIDISGNRTKLVDEFLTQSFDYVITVCDDAREACPVFPGSVKNRLHFSFEDPSAASGSEDEIIAVFRHVRDEIISTFRQFYNENLKGL